MNEYLKSIAWKGSGKSPDYRFTLANERTFLAWIRTALAFMAAAVGLDQLTPDLTPPELHAVLVEGMSIVSAILACYAWRRWKSNEQAMRHDAELAYPRLLLWLSVSLAVSTLATTTVLILL
ncbi:TPA: YidH family protein [Citrobacter sedlakii]